MKVTVREAIDGGYWDELCDLTGIKVLLDEDTEIELTDEQAGVIRFLGGKV